MTQADSREIKIPTVEEVNVLIADISETLLKIAETGPPAETDRIRELLKRLTGGKIELFQKGEKKPRKGWLQGRFKTPLIPVLLEQLTGMPSDHQDEKDYQEVIIDFHIPDRDNEKVELVWQLYQEGKLGKDIAEIVDIPEGTVGSRLNRARRELQQHLTDLGWEQ